MIPKEVYLQCGWEDECKLKDCHNCPRKQTVTITITEAELCVVEDCATIDLIEHQKERPDVYNLTQAVMLDLMRKLFKETDEV